MFRVLRSSRVISPYRWVKKVIYGGQHGTKNKNGTDRLREGAPMRPSRLLKADHCPQDVRIMIGKKMMIRHKEMRLPPNHEGHHRARKRTMMLDPATTALRTLECPQGEFDLIRRIGGNALEQKRRARIRNLDWILYR